MDLKKPIKQGGFSLAEIMVTVAVLGILSTVVVNQVQLTSATKRETNTRAIINGIYDKLSMELARQQTCSAPPNKNFYNQAINNTDVTFPITDSAGNTIIVKDGIYGLKNIAGNVYASAGNAEFVTVKSIKTYAGASVNEAILEVVFGTKRGTIASLFKGEDKIQLKLNVVPNAGGTLFKYCYNDATASITAAVRLACSGNASYFEDPVTYPPYGRCVVEDTDQACPAGQFITKIAMANGKIVTTCAALASSCGTTGQIIYGYNANGSPKCDWPLPRCQAGQILVKSSSGPYVCSNTNTGCGATYAIQGFNTDGSVACAQYNPAQTCGSGYVTAYSPNNITCSPGSVSAITCGPGQFIAGTNASNQPYCANWINLGVPCAAGTAVTGIDSNADIVCTTLERRLSCNGAFSPGGKKYSDCRNISGATVLNPGTTNAFCRLSGSTCPAGFTQCLSWGNSAGVPSTTSCTDTNSACSYSVQTRSTTGTGVWQNPMSSSQRTAQCYYWARNSGSWVKSCTMYTGPVSPPSGITEVGCY